MDTFFSSVKRKIVQEESDIQREKDNRAMQQLTKQYDEMIRDRILHILETHCGQLDRLRHILQLVENCKTTTEVDQLQFESDEIVKRIAASVGVGGVDNIVALRNDTHPSCEWDLYVRTQWNGYWANRGNIYKIIVEGPVMWVDVTKTIVDRRGWISHYGLTFRPIIDYE